ncbi:helix-turn-helix domain-containing protein [Xylophilus ampelinus]|uniref:Helix-turn-helix protein n=1 Tax=Xylophilus ampelinus TaxID=54067 RepID=A0A318SX07_9BURK|nr:helix-turn-helix domain-containing protein [Xylophilus ampelinus]MCS4510866.1 helix-turn-helix domain-containing protein [Xylophilus ampelinus]PYE76153.1 helix-turn-helix protein [Xylophilus ampelinus]
MKTVGERIRQAREARGLSQGDLALRVGFAHQSAIGNLESRATGRGGFRLSEIARELSVSVEWLLNGPDGPVPFVDGDAAPAGDHVRVQAESPRPLGLLPDLEHATELLRGLPREGVKEAISHLEFLTYKHRRPPEPAGRATPGVKPGCTPRAS